MAVEIWWGSGSAYAWRVLLALRAKGVEYTSHLLSFSARDHKTPEYLAINPRGKVPSLRHDDVVVHESIAILAYLDRAFPAVPLFGATAAEAARVWTDVIEVVTTIEADFTVVVRGLFFRPLEADPAEVNAAAARLCAELDRYEAVLGGQAFLSTDSLSASDLTFYPHLRGLLRAQAKPEAPRFELGFDMARWPRLATWMGQIEAISGFAETEPPHWREG